MGLKELLFKEPAEGQDRMYLDQEMGESDKWRSRGDKLRGRGWQMARGDRNDFGELKDHGLHIRREPPGRGRLVRDGQRQAATNGYGPVRCGLRNARMHPYPDHRGPRGGRDGPPGYGPLMRGEMDCNYGGHEDFPFPLPPRFRGGPPPPPPPPPPGTMGFRGRHRFPRGRGMWSVPRGDFRPPRGFHNGPGLPPPPPIRGQRWPGPPGGRRF